MGVNTQNYQLKSFPPTDGLTSFLEDLLDKKYRDFASPAKWAKVLQQKQYEALRLNLAHFGGVEREDWRDQVAELVLKYANVYTDISYQGVDQKIYGKLKLFLDSKGTERLRLMEKIIFGSDFMINPDFIHEVRE